MVRIPREVSDSDILPGSAFDQLDRFDQFDQFDKLTAGKAHGRQSSRQAKLTVNKAQPRSTPATAQNATSGAGGGHSCPPLLGHPFRRHPDAMGQECPTS